MRLAGRGALVTGAGGGNGLSVVARRKHDGAKVLAASFELDAFEADALICRELADEDFASTMAGNAVAPGRIDSELNSEFVESMPDPEHFMKRTGSAHPVGRSGRQDEMGAPTTWLASTDASFAAGRVYAVDSGRMVGLSLS